MTQNILVVLGTRPEAIKLAPLVLYLKEMPGYNVILCNTEQQKELSSQTLQFFDLKADINLDIMHPNQTLPEVQSTLIKALHDVFTSHRIAMTLIQGDTMSAFCGALVSFYHHVPIGHLEAGLRSYDLQEPFPEEGLRQMISRIATLHFAPTEQSACALQQESIPQKNIFITGNTVIDALHALPQETLHLAEKTLQKNNILSTDSDKRIILITVHRRENQTPERLQSILQAIKKLAHTFTDDSFIFPVHPNPNVREPVYQMLSEVKNITLCNPLDYPELICIMKQATLILTDSGGIQEEAPTFNVPILVLRNETERTEGIKARCAKLIGTQKETIIKETTSILNGTDSFKKIEENPYGKGDASIKITKIIQTFFQTEESLIP